MKHFYIIANSRRPGTKKTAEEITRYLKKHGASCTVDAGTLARARKLAGGNASEGLSAYDGGYTLASDVPAGTECVITLGGDGTLIQAARDLVELSIPLIGINRGNLGYLTQVGRGEELPPVLDALLEDHFRLERRMMVRGRVISAIDGHVEAEGIALNEIALLRSQGAQPIRFGLEVNGQFLNCYTADGMIASTPTGSTAYNLSAGGPIVAPHARVMVMTPICPHALGSHSIVLSHHDTVRLRARDQEGQHAYAVFDGDQQIDMGDDRILEISEAEQDTTLVQLHDVSFLDNLRNKMRSL